jgi:predicted alpha/beta-hydrolase family hydrolase
MSSAGALLLAPGAGADRNHHTLCAVADAMSPLPVERMDFPARKAGRKGVDRAPVAIAAVVDEATQLVSSAKVRANRLVLGGRSFGGRMCSMAVSEGLPAAGLVLLSYPLHPPGKPETLRVDHFASLDLPCLFISGEKDPFGTPAEFRKHLKKISGDVTFIVVPGAHDPRGQDEAIAEHVRTWVRALR